jgi:hypothetical protein
MAQLKPRLISVGDFVAESLETEANKLPPSKKEQAEIWRTAAKSQRELGSKKMIRVWEEMPEENKSTATKYHMSAREAVKAAERRGRQ